MKKTSVWDWVCMSLVNFLKGESAIGMNAASGRCMGCVAGGEQMLYSLRASKPQATDSCMSCIGLWNSKFVPLIQSRRAGQKVSRLPMSRMDSCRRRLACCRAQKT